MEKYIFLGLDCANCALKLEQEIKKLDCVDFVSINFATLSMKIKTTNMNRGQFSDRKNRTGCMYSEMQ